MLTICRHQAWGKIGLARGGFFYSRCVAGGRRAKDLNICPLYDSQMWRPVGGGATPKRRPATAAENEDDGGRLSGSFRRRIGEMGARAMLAVAVGCGGEWSRDEQMAAVGNKDSSTGPNVNRWAFAVVAASTPGANMTLAPRVRRDPAPRARRSPSRPLPSSPHRHPDDPLPPLALPCGPWSCQPWWRWSCPGRWRGRGEPWRPRRPPPPPPETSWKTQALFPV